MQPRKALFILLLLILCAFLAGCGAAEKPAPSADAVASRVAQEIYATLTAQAATQATTAPSPTPIPTGTPTPLPTDTPTPQPTRDTRETDYIKSAREVRALYLQFTSAIMRSFEQFEANYSLRVDPVWRADYDSTARILDQAAGELSLLQPPPACEALHSKLYTVQDLLSQSVVSIKTGFDTLDSDAMLKGSSDMTEGIKILTDLSPTLDSGRCR